MAEVRTYFPAWRVFIFGVDVTDDVTRCTVTYSGADSRAPSVAEIELVNGGSRDGQGEYLTDRYIITKEDIAVLYGEEESLAEVEFPDEKQIYKDLLDARRFGDEADRLDGIGLATQPLPTLQAALSIYAPEQVTGDPEVDTQRAEQLRALSGLSEEEFRREAARRALTREEAEARFQEALDESLTQAAQNRDSLSRIVRERIEARITDPVKRQVLLAKFDKRQDTRGRAEFDPYSSRSIPGLQGLNGEVMRYPFHTGDNIFHSQDPVRIFWRDPASPERWYHMFAGFVSDTVDEVNEHDERVVRLRFEDASRILRYARLTTNPGILDIDDIRTRTDAISRTFFNESYANLTLPEFLFGLIFGAEKAGLPDQGGIPQVRQVRTYANVRVSANDESTSPLVEDAVGSFNYERSFVAVYGARAVEERAEVAKSFPAVYVNDLGEYQALIDHQVLASDIDNMGLPDRDSQIKIRRLAETIRERPNGDKYIEDVIQVLGENPHLFPVDYGRLICLFPASLGPGTNIDLLLRSFTDVATQTTWRSRLGLIYDVVSRFDFSFYCSPRGDLICEMPLYDFLPDDFGDSLVDVQRVLSQGNIKYSFSSSDRERGPYGPALRVGRRDTESWSRSFMDENVRTQLVGVYSLIPGFAEFGTSADVGINKPVNLYGLAAQFGFRSESIDPMGLIGSEEAARLYASVKANQINAKARTANVQVLPRVQAAFPNRPMEFEERVFVATTTNTTHSLVWGQGGNMTTDLDLTYIRAWGGQTAEGRPVYEPIGGFASQDFNYAIRLGLARTRSVLPTKPQGS